MPDNPNLPRKGTTARKIYDCIERVKEGITAFEIERACGVIKNQHTYIASLADKQLITVIGKRDVEGLKNLDVWATKKARTSAVKKGRKLGNVPRQKLDPYECPACGKTIYLLLPWGEHGKDQVEIETKLRIIVFDGPYQSVKYTDEDGKEAIAKLPKEPLTLFEEHSGKLVLGRAATDTEREYFADNHKLRKPWTLGYEGHLKSCKKLNRWLNGKAQEKRRTWPVKWDPGKRRFGFIKEDNTPKISMTEPAKEEKKQS